MGYNVTRLLSTVYGQTLSVGRVMTPTLALVVAREDAIVAFQPIAYYTVALDCGGFTASSERYTQQAGAESIARQCNGSDCVVRRVAAGETRKPAPAL